MNLGGGEVLVILLVALLVLGPTRLPEAARQVGKAMKTIRQVSTGFQDEMRHAIEDTIEADAAKDAGVSHTPASRPGSRRPAPPDPDDQPDPGGPTDLTVAAVAATAADAADVPPETDPEAPEPDAPDADAPEPDAPFVDTADASPDADAVEGGVAEGDVVEGDAAEGDAESETTTRGETSD